MKGIKHRLTIPRTPQQNGSAERLNQTLLNIVRCLLIHSGLPAEFWGEALAAANFIRNRCPSKAIHMQIRYERWYKRRLHEEDIKMMKTFGCRAWALKLETKKLDPRAVECIHLGIQENVKGYRLGDIHERKILLSRDVVFEENNFQFKTKISVKEQSVLESSETEVELSIDVDGRTEETVKDDDDVHEEREDAHVQLNSEDVDENIRRSSRQRKMKHCICCNQVKKFDQGTSDVEEMLSGKDGEKWIDAMKQELNEIEENKTWILVKRPHDRNVIGCRWVFKTKYNKDGSVERYRARLVAQGHKQIYGFDYWETYSPVIRRDSLRIFLALAVQKEWAVHHVDMEQPKFFKRGSEDLVYLLKKSLYGLHQSGKMWNEHISKALAELTPKQCVTDPCVFMGAGVILGVYVDDVILLGELQ